MAYEPAPGNSSPPSLLQKGSQALRDGRVAAATELFTQSIAEAKDPAQRAIAFRLRGASLRRSDHPELAIPDYTTVIDMPQAPTYQRFMAHFGRAIIHDLLDHADLALADYGAALRSPEASLEQIASLLTWRAILYSKLHRAELALADYAAVLAMSNVPTGQKAYIRRNRAVFYMKHKQFDRAIAEFDIVQAMLDAPLEERVTSLGTGISRCRYLQGDFPRAIAAARAAVALDPAHVRSRFNLALALLAENLHVDEALAEYRRCAADSTSRTQLLEDGLEDLRALIQKSSGLTGASTALALLENRLAELPEKSLSVPSPRTAP